MIKERVSLPKGNDGVFSVFVYKQAQEIHGSIGQEVLRQNREALNLSEVQKLSVKAKNTFSGKMKELPYHIKNDSEHPNLLFVEFPKELQEIASFNLIIEFDIPLESLADKLLHRLVELPFVEITKSTEKAPMVEDVVFVADVVPAIIGEKGERGEQGLQGIQGEKGDKGDKLTFADLTEQDKRELKGERGQDGINGTNGENGRDGRDGANGKSALELLNEENQEFISKLKELMSSCEVLDKPINDKLPLDYAGMGASYYFYNALAKNSMKDANLEKTDIFTLTRYLSQMKITKLVVKSIGEAGYAISPVIDSKLFYQRENQPLVFFYSSLDAATYEYYLISPFVTEYILFISNFISKEDLSNDSSNEVSIISFNFPFMMAEELYDIQVTGFSSLDIITKIKNDFADLKNGEKGYIDVDYSFEGSPQNLTGNEKRITINVIPN